MRKGILTLIVITFMINLYTGISYAEGADMECGYTINVGNNMVSGSVSLADSRRTHKIIVKVINGENNIVYVNELYPDDEGKVDFNYINEDNNGEYTMSIHSKELNETQTYSFKMLSDTKKNELCTIVNTERLKNNQTPPVAPNVNSVKAVYLNNYEALNIDMTEYNTLLNKEDVFVMIAAESGEVSGIDELLTAFYNAVVRLKINSSHSENDVTSFLTSSIYRQAIGYNKIPIIGDKNVYETSSDTVKGFISESIAKGTYTNEQHLKDSIVFEVLSENILHSTLWNNLLPTVKAYCDAGYLNVSAAEYNVLTSSDYILRSLIGKDFTSYNAIEDAIENAYKESTKNTNSGSGGSGGGSGGGGFVIKPSTSVTPIESVADSGKASNKFVDMDDYKWAIQAVNALYERGIISGVDDEHFEPGRGITRAELVKILVCVCGWGEENNVSNFTDVLQETWYYPYVSTAYEKGIVVGNPDNTFMPTKIISRYELAVMINKIMEYYKIPDEVNRQDKIYDDDAEIPEWAKESVYKVQLNGTMLANTGNDFDGTVDTTRAYAASVIYKLVEQIEEMEVSAE